MGEQRVLAAIEEIKKGNMVIMMDDEDRENEGDLVYASIFSTPEKVNFMATHARGLICVAVTKETATALELDPMIKNNTSNHETAFTISVDAKEATTGISAGERDMTIKLLANGYTKPTDLVRPGHIFPLIAKDGGVLVRTGHTEGSVDLCRMAGLAPSGVICEIIKTDGTMARKPDLEIFAQEHNLKIIYISDLVEYRLKNESLVRFESESEVEFHGVKALKKEFNDHQGTTHTVIVFGEPKSSSNVKFHLIERDIKILSAKSKITSFLDSVEYLKQNGGVLIYLNNQTGENEQKNFGIGAGILKSLGIQRLNLLTSSAGHDFVGLGGFGLSIEKTTII